MATTEDIARLILEADAKGFLDAEKQVQLVEGSLAALNASYKSGAVGVADYLHQGQLLRSQLDELRGGLDVATAALKKHGNAQDAAAALAAKATKANRQLNQSVTAGSYALQDFAATSGDLGAKLNSITNNIPALLGGMGGLGTAISLAVVAGVSLYRNWDSLVRLFETKNPFPETEQSVKGMKKEVEKARDAMEKLEANTSLTGSEMEKYQQLREKVATTEAKITKEEERQAELKKLKEIKDPEAEAGDKQRKEILGEGLGGQQDQIIAAVAKHLNEANDAQRDISEHRISQLTDRANQVTGEEQRKLLQEIKAERQTMAQIPTVESRKDEAQGIVTGSMVRGDLGSYRKLQGAVIDRPELFTDDQRGTIEAASPEQIAANKAEDDAEKLQEEKNKDHRDRVAIHKQIEAAKEKEAKEEEQKTANRAKPVIASMGKGPALMAMAKKTLGEIDARGGVIDSDGNLVRKSQEEQIEIVQQQLQEAIEDELDKRGLLNDTSRKAAASTATQLAGQAHGKLAGDRKKAGDEHKDAQTAYQKRFGEQNKAIAGSGLEAYGEKRISKFLEAGGTLGQDGRLGQRDHQGLVAELAAEIRRANPRMSARDVHQHASAIAGQAESGIQNKILGMTGAGFNQVQVTQQLLLQTTQQLNQALMKMQGIQSTNRDIRRQVTQNGEAGRNLGR